MPDTAAPSATLLLVEDTASLRMVYESVLRQSGYRVEAVGSVAEARYAFAAMPADVVLLDLMLPDGDGLALMQEVLALRRDTAVIVITANGSINKAVEAMRAGAADFLVKPFEDQRLTGAVENALSGRNLSAVPPAGLEPPGPFIGRSPVMEQVYARIGSVARSMATVFITGESGTGKELAAQAVHDASPRRGGPFIALNCGAIPPDMLESEVFGHLRGSFPGAISDKTGAAAAADGGTLFLDEICEMNLSLQTKLLRFLQTSNIQPVGAPRAHKVSVRILCATNRDPEDAVRRGQFREDLYYRLHVVPIHMPPLRERGSDVIDIAEAALARFSAEEGRSFTAIDPGARDMLRAHGWPGNVRQLLNVLRQVVVLNDGPLLTAGMLPDGIASGTGASRVVPLVQPGLDSLIGLTLAEIERLVIEEAIARHGGSIPRAARELDVSPSTLYRKLESWQRTRD